MDVRGRTTYVESGGTGDILDCCHTFDVGTVKPRVFGGVNTLDRGLAPGFERYPRYPLACDECVAAVNTALAVAKAFEGITDDDIALHHGFQVVAAFKMIPFDDDKLGLMYQLYLDEADALSRAAA